MTHTFQLDNRLKNDTHLLIDRDDLLLLLHKNANIPWIIIVPKTDVIEVYDLPDHMQQSLNILIKQIANYFKNKIAIEKMNIAAIGNIVSQLHVHVIGRKTSDACWPNVVWGNKYPFLKYTPKQISNISKKLSQML